MTSQLEDSLKELCCRERKKELYGQIKPFVITSPFIDVKSLISRIKVETTIDECIGIILLEHKEPVIRKTITTRVLSRTRVPRILGTEW